MAPATEDADFIPPAGESAPAARSSSSSGAGRGAGGGRSLSSLATDRPPRPPVVRPSVSAHASEPRAARRLSANGDTSLSSLPVSSRPADRPPVIPPPLPVAATVETAFTEGNRGNDG